MFPPQVSSTYLRHDSLAPRVSSPATALQGLVPDGEEVLGADLAVTSSFPVFGVKLGPPHRPCRPPAP